MKKSIYAVRVSQNPAGDYQWFFAERMLDTDDKIVFENCQVLVPTETVIKPSSIGEKGVIVFPKAKRHAIIAATPVQALPWFKFEEPPSAA